jgi:acid phosphatase family membrane protein YuiD
MEIFYNVCIWAALVAWFSAQFIKIIISLIQDHEFSFRMFMASGGMPSSHSAAVCAMAASLGLMQGFDSPVFALAGLMAFIVMYDATGVRRETGEQSKILNKIVANLSDGKTKYLNRDLKELVGHTPIQVFAGATLGIVIGLLTPYVYYFIVR